MTQTKHHPKQWITLAAGILAFGMLMAVRDECSTRVQRTTVAAAAGLALGCGIAVFRGQSLLKWK